MWDHVPSAGLKYLMQGNSAPADNPPRSIPNPSPFRFVYHHHSAYRAVSAPQSQCHLNDWCWTPTFTLEYDQTLGPLLLILILVTQISWKLLLNFTVSRRFLAVIKPSCLVSSKSTVL